MKIVSISNKNQYSFNGRFLDFLSKLKIKTKPRIYVPEVVDTVITSQYGVTKTRKLLKNGQVMDTITYPKRWPNTDVVFSESMCKKIDKDIAGFRMQVPNSYLKNHPEAATEEGAIDFAKKIRALAHDVFHSNDKEKQTNAIKEFAKILGIKEGSYIPKINGQL